LLIFLDFYLYSFVKPVAYFIISSMLHALFLNLFVYIRVLLYLSVFICG